MQLKDAFHQSEFQFSSHYLKVLFLESRKQILVFVETSRGFYTRIQYWTFQHEY